MPSESPTSTMSTPASSTRRAIVKSYAVTATSEPTLLRERISGTVTFLSWWAPALRGIRGSATVAPPLLFLAPRLLGDLARRALGCATVQKGMTPVRVCGALSLLGALSCNGPPSASSLQEWTPSDHHSSDDDRLRGTPEAPAKSGPAQRGNPASNV